MRITNSLLCRLPKSPFLVVLLIVGLSSCSGDDTSTNNGGSGGNNGNNGSSHKLIRFKITCGGSSQPGVFGVRIFDESTGVRLVSGSSSSSGEFCSLSRLSTDGSYRIEFYELPSWECVVWVRNITYQDDPVWWADDCGDPTQAVCHIGDCEGNEPRTDCWEE